MLKVTELINFTEVIKNLFPDTIEEGLVVVDDDDLALFAKEINTQKKALLVVVLPSATPNSKDSDRVEFKDLGSFMFLQKKAKNEGYKVFTDKMIFTQNVAILFIKHLQKIASKEIACVPGYDNIDFPSLSADPTSIKGYCGYSIDFNTKNFI
jgi:hypothetical protein